MIDRDAPPALRVQFVVAIMAFVALGAVSAWVGIATLARVLERSAAGAPLIAFRPLYVTGLPLAVAFLALAVLALLPGETRTRAHGGGWRVRPTRIAFGVVIGSMLVAIVTTPLAAVWVGHVMRARGYAACPTTDTERPPPLRWVRDDGRCP